MNYLFTSRTGHTYRMRGCGVCKQTNVSYKYYSTKGYILDYRVCSECEKLPDLQERLNVLYITELL